MLSTNPSFERSSSIRSVSSWDNPNMLASMSKFNANISLAPNTPQAYESYAAAVAKAGVTATQHFLTNKRILIIVATTILVIASIACFITTSYLYSSKKNDYSEADYGESCLKKVCSQSKQLQCINQTCTCDKSLSVWNPTVSQCKTVSMATRYHGNTCQLGYTQCLNNTQCISLICQCDTTTSYWNGSTCVAQKGYMASCGQRATQLVSASNDPINCVSDAECTECSSSDALLKCSSTSNGVCLCPSSLYYYDNLVKKCLLLKSYYALCMNSSECDSTIGLFCQNITGQNTTANCPSTSLLNRCDCQVGFYFDYTFRKCIVNKGNQRPCTSSCECDPKIGLQCYGSLCSCPPYTLFNGSVCAPNRLGTYSSNCTFSNDCDNNRGLGCSNTSVCDCLNPSRYYWNNTLKFCVECPDGWVILKSSTNISRCYLFSNAASTTDYNTARSRCQAYAGDLMVINDAAEYNALLAYSNTIPAVGYWLGIYGVDNCCCSYSWYFYYWLGGQVIGYYSTGNFNNGVVPRVISWTSSCSPYTNMYLLTGLGNFGMYNVYYTNGYRYICEKTY